MQAPRWIRFSAKPISFLRSCCTAHLSGRPNLDLKAPKLSSWLVCTLGYACLVELTRRTNNFKGVCAVARNNTLRAIMETISSLDHNYGNLNNFLTWAPASVAFKTFRLRKLHSSQLQFAIKMSVATKQWYGVYAVARLQQGFTVRSKMYVASLKNFEELIPCIVSLVLSEKVGKSWNV